MSSETATLSTNLNSTTNTTTNINTDTDTATPATTIVDTKKIEINLKRLISSCEKIIADDDRVDVVNGNGEIRPVLIDNTFTVERYIPIMLSLLKQLNEKMYEQNKQLSINNNNTTNATSGGITSLYSLPSQIISQQFQQSISPAQQTPSSSTTTNTYNISKETLCEYSRKIDVIVGLVNKEKMNSPISNKPSIVRLQASDLSHSKKMNEIQTVMKTRNKEEKKKIDMLLPQQQDNSSSSSSNSNNINNNNNNNNNINSRKNNSTPLSPAVKYRNTFQNRNSELKNLLGNKAAFNDNLFDNEILDDDSFEKRAEEQRRLQDSLTNELLDYSKTMKNHSHTMSTKLTEEDKKLSELGQLVDTSSSKIQRQNQNLKDYTSSSTRDTLNYCLIIIVVLIMFISTYLFMKLSKKAIIPIDQTYQYSPTD